MRRIGFFKRIGKPIQIGSNIVRPGDIIKADFDFIMEQKEGGWLYLKTPAQASQPQQKPQVRPQQKPPTFEPEVIKTEDAVKDVLQMYENIEKERQAQVEKKDDAPIVVNIDKLKELKSLSNKDWITVKKDQCIKLLTESHVDFSHVPNEKWALVKFIKGIIKDL
jgi:hypothetical protein